MFSIKELWYKQRAHYAYQQADRDRFALLASRAKMQLRMRQVLAVEKQNNRYFGSNKVANDIEFVKSRTHAAIDKIDRMFDGGKLTRMN
jgi:hypothetical protein